MFSFSFLSDVSDEMGFSFLSSVILSRKPWAILFRRSLWANFTANRIGRRQPNWAGGPPDSENLQFSRDLRVKGPGGSSHRHAEPFAPDR